MTIRGICELLSLFAMPNNQYPGIQWSGKFFRIFKLIIYSFIVAMSDLVHDVEAIHTAKTDNSIWKPFLKYE